jgi:hypothetical protein
MTAAHQHDWRLVSHLDGCHWYSTAAACPCGATLRQGGERDLKEDPFSAVWMDDADDATQCQRCRDLLAGAAPEPFTNEIVDAAT